jgi:glycosyltransferase involved in cell wall biosynthesis
MRLSVIYRSLLYDLLNFLPLCVEGIAIGCMPKRICFLVRHLNDGYSGGAELQVQLYSRALAQRGWNVWVIGEGVPTKGGSMLDDGVHYVFLPPRKRGLGLLNYSRIRAVLARIRPHVCYQRVKLDYTYWTVRLARRLGSNSLFAFSHDHECIPGTLAGRQGDLVSRFIAVLADQGIRKADHLLCQTVGQRSLIKEHFAREATIIKNGHPLPGVVKESLRERPEVVWVNHLKPVKQPELFFRLASEFKKEDVVFTLIGAPGAYPLEKEFAQIEYSPNLNFLGEQSLEQVNDRLWGCRLVVNTSRAEGFPNTFIQAWARFVPVVSLKVDPDGVIVRHQLGFCSGDFSRMVSHTRMLIREQGLAAEMGKNGRAYVEQEHDLAENVRKLDQTLQQFIK